MSVTPTATEAGLPHLPEFLPKEKRGQRCLSDELESLLLLLWLGLALRMQTSSWVKALGRLRFWVGTSTGARYRRPIQTRCLLTTRCLTRPGT